MTSQENEHDHRDSLLHIGRYMDAHMYTHTDFIPQNILAHFLSLGIKIMKPSVTPTEENTYLHRSTHDVITKEYNPLYTVTQLTYPTSQTFLFTRETKLFKGQCIFCPYH